ncbi:hypothetical protein [Bacillus sp. Marseille-P3800]|uniref:hypothetical protein n=1 Tax=Bacillus sp. Marseille-P3800 TaxID=2014782 RepID=UPI000C072BAB|nr:hypothetical protein [Bacillus sp. Marseille-P3800]
MPNHAFIELSSKIVNKTAEREQKDEFVKAIKELTSNGLSPQVLWEINEIITRTADKVLKPKLDFYEKIADVERIGFGEKLRFDIPQDMEIPMAWTGRGTTVDFQRIQKAGKVDVEPELIAGGVQYEFRQLLTGDVDGFVGAVDALANSMDAKISARVMSTLHLAMASAPANNRWTGAGIQKQDFNKLGSIVGRYGQPVGLFDRDLAIKITDLVPGSAQSDAMKEKINSDRSLGRVSGVDITTFTNPFAAHDMNNEEYAVPRQYGYIFPAGYNKPIKIGFEGDLLQDTQKDIHSERVFLKVSQLVGVRALTDLRNVAEINDTTLS